VTYLLIIIIVIIIITHFVKIDKPQNKRSSTTYLRPIRLVVVTSGMLNHYHGFLSNRFYDKHKKRNDKMSQNTLWSVFPTLSTLSISTWSALFIRENKHFCYCNTGFLVLAVLFITFHRPIANRTTLRFSGKNRMNLRSSVNSLTLNSDELQVLKCYT
jgi:hypothetical protein